MSKNVDISRSKKHNKTFPQNLAISQNLTILENKNVLQKKRPNGRIQVLDNLSNKDIKLQKKLSQLVELQNGIEILKERMDLSKKDLINYFDQNPELKIPKYAVGEKYIRYVDKKTTDSLSQKLIILGLSEYFKNRGIQDIEIEVSEALSMILIQRKFKMVPTIDITKDKSFSASDINNNEE